MSPSMRCVVAFLCAVLGSAASNSEVAPEISQLGPTELCEYSLKLIQKHFEGMTVLDLQHILYVANVSCKLSAIQGQEGSCLNCAVSINPDSVMETFTNCNFKLNGSWAVADGKGPFVASVRDLSINTTVIVTEDDTGNTSVEFLSCSCSGGDFKGKLCGTNSEMYETYLMTVCDSVRSMMRNEACDETRKVTEGLGEQLTSTQGSS
ncbi:bactericidal permeability-increasing protein-like [Ambystoma mexicanum]|uniref:bactericidal permeability-increasing protein-like n=1 Tax=Ambystoma mexicanum TaxID=8296 RepID=UPI0037E77786